MEFHPDKCEVIHITHKRSTIKSVYTLHDHILKEVDAAKYLGVTITSDLKWNKHIANTAAKANRVLGFLRRNLKINSTDLKSTAYKTLIRPTLEYASCVWDPYTQTNIDQLEMVQRRSARFALNRWDRTDSVTQMLSELEWCPLQERRKTSRLIMMFKITQELVTVPIERYLQTTRRPSRLCHDAGYIVPSSTKDFHKFSFFPRTTREWNVLPPDIAKAETLEAFKQGLNSLSSA